MRDLLPVLKRAIDSLGTEDGAGYRRMFAPYLLAAESSGAPTAAALGELANRHNAHRFLPLLDATGAPTELIRELGIERLPLPEYAIRPIELADYEVVATSGAGDRFRVVREVAPGYRIVESGEIIRRPRVEVRAE
jgi:hypothetical protein